MRKNKFSIRLLLISLGLLLFIQVPTFAANKGKSTATNVRIREDASTQSEVIDVLAEGDEVEILTEEGDWYKVSAKGHTGYVSKSFITIEGENVQNNEPEQNNNEINNNENNTTGNNEQENNVETEPNTENTQQSVPVNKVYKVAEKTQIYILPVLNSEIIGEVKKDDNVTLLNNAGLWVYVQTNTANGWVRIDKLSTENVNIENTSDAQNNENSQDTNTTSENEQNAENKDENQTAQNEENVEQQKTYEPKTMYVKASAINVRSQSNTSSDIVTSAALNTEVKVVGEENGWYKVEVNGKSGYIRNDLLSNEKTEVTSRDNNVDRTEIVAQQNNNTQSTTQTTAPTQTTTQTATNTTTSVPTSSTGVTGNDIVAYAKQFVGCRYVYGAAGPNSFDCSGLTMYVYKHFGYSLSHSSRIQATQGKAVTGELQPGDILVFTNGGTQVGHVGIYIGNDKFVHASDSTTGVIISNLSDSWNKSKYVGARRIL